jgi:hypothetical protein
MHELGAQVLIAAILLPVIRDDGMTLGGCSTWRQPMSSVRPRRIRF